MTEAEGSHQRAIVLSGRQVSPLIRAWSTGENAAITSLDLGLTIQEVPLTGAGVVLPGDQVVSWEIIGEIEAQGTACFLITAGTAEKIARFSALTNRPYSLMATEGAPTLVVAGFTMHRIVGIEPSRDTQMKMKALGRVHGRVLDTCTGLGYTAIAAAKTSDEVVTIELDPVTLQIARLNPWSRGLFAEARIVQEIGDSSERIAEFPDRTFTAIIHDPPAFSLAGDLYSGAFYRQLFRVLQQGGRVFHYIGQVESKFSQSLARGVIRRLTDAGFARVERAPQAFGLLAYKG